QTMADYGGNDTSFRTIKTAAIANITDYGKNPDGSFRVAIDVAMKKAVETAKTDPAGIVPGTRSETPTGEPVSSHSKPIQAPAAAGSGSDAGSGAGSAAGSGSAASAGSGSAVAPMTATPPAAPMVPTGGQAQGGGPAPTTGANNAGTNNAG